MDTPLVSIIVPVYQAERFLKKSIESILNQTLENIEIILVNDGSTDRSNIICDQLATNDKRIKVIHKQNGGQSAARNTGLATSSGKYIGFMDNDDLLFPDMCKKLYENAEKHHADISAASFITQDERGIRFHDKHTGETILYNNRQGMKAYLSRQTVDIYVWTKIYRKDFLDKHAISFEGDRSDEDLLFNYMAFSAAETTVMEDTAVYLYMERNDSTSRIFPKKKLHKYLDDSYYRTKKIEEEVRRDYPELLSMAQIQTVKAYVRMLFIMSKHQRKECEPYYSEIKKYLKRNAKIVIQERKHWGMSLVGTLLASYMQPSLYFYLKKKKHQNDIL